VIESVYSPKIIKEVLSNTQKPSSTLQGTVKGTRSYCISPRGKGKGKGNIGITFGVGIILKPFRDVFENTNKSDRSAEVKVLYRQHHAQMRKKLQRNGRRVTAISNHEKNTKIGIISTSKIKKYYSNEDQRVQ
jgi:hypothetical protein